MIKVVSYFEFVKCITNLVVRIQAFFAAVVVIVNRYPQLLQLQLYKSIIFVNG